MADLVRRLPSADYRLGRNIVHDERSRAFPRQVSVDRSTWRTRNIRIYDPRPNPEQCHGECTGCAKAMQLNAVGNRVRGTVLAMPHAHDLYSWASNNDPFAGAWPPDDTGSSGLASAKAAQHAGLGGEYRWIFGGADEVVQTIMVGMVVSVGTRWDWSMFSPDSTGRIHLGGGAAGGHQYVARGYDVDRDWLLLRCWWGSFRDVWISREDLGELLADHGDAHTQVRA